MHRFRWNRCFKDLFSTLVTIRKLRYLTRIVLAIAEYGIKELIKMKLMKGDSLEVSDDTSKV